MVADMTGARSLGLNSCALLLGVISIGVSAQSLPDPTRPPDSIFTPVDQKATPKDSGLQSLIISPTRRAAIINGQTVELGEMLGDAKLVEVNESYVVLRNAEGKRVLSMFEGVEIRKIVAALPVAKAATYGSKKNKSVGVRTHQVKPPKSTRGDRK